MESMLTASVMQSANSNIYHPTGLWGHRRGSGHIYRQAGGMDRDIRPNQLALNGQLTKQTRSCQHETHIPDTLRPAGQQREIPPLRKHQLFFFALWFQNPSILRSRAGQINKK